MKVSQSPTHKASDVHGKMLMNEIDSWIDLLLRIILSNGDALSSSDFIGRVLEESARSRYMRQKAAAKVACWCIFNTVLFN
jgi:hypothetical protein